MANEKIVTLENLTTYNDKIQDKITAIDERIEYLESNAGVSPSTKILWLGTSIPAGDANVDPNNNYPKMVGDRLRCKVYNKSIIITRIRQMCQPIPSTITPNYWIFYCCSTNLVRRPI